MKKLGIIAGGGTLPREVILACQQQKRPFFVLALKGFLRAGFITQKCAG